MLDARAHRLTVTTPDEAVVEADPGRLVQIFSNLLNNAAKVFSHVMVGSNDIERSRRFYDAVLGVLGAGAPLRNEAKTGHARLFYRHDGATFCVSESINGEAASERRAQSSSTAAATQHTRA